MAVFSQFFHVTELSVRDDLHPGKIDLLPAEVNIFPVDTHILPDQIVRINGTGRNLFHGTEHGMHETIQDQLLGIFAEKPSFHILAGLGIPVHTMIIWAAGFRWRMPREIC